MTTIDKELQARKARDREMWATGDYPTVAKRHWDVGARIVESVGVHEGEDVLDVACGTGNAAIPAAVAGARVVGVDLTPELFDAARRLAAQAGVEVDWCEGDAEALPFPDAGFDVVLSVFGCMFAPRHEVVAAEIARVLRPGGRIGLCNWTPEGALGGFFGVLGRHLPAPPPFVSPPPRWGDPAHVRTLFADSGIQLAFDREIVELEFASVADLMEFELTRFGPVMKAYELLEPQGRWPALRDDLLSYFTDNTESRDGAIVWPGEYLIVSGQRE